MATLSTLFLESTCHAATEHGLEAHPLPDHKGLLLLAAGLAGAEQYTLLQEMAAGLQTAQVAPPPQGQHAAQHASAAAQSTIDCQVSVEERAQLFKFLTG